ncbi:MAG: TlpA disulfide reductase family protein [Planctomycetota bacterium]
MLRTYILISFAMIGVLISGSGCQTEPNPSGNLESNDGTEQSTDLPTEQAAQSKYDILQSRFKDELQSLRDKLGSASSDELKTELLSNHDPLGNFLEQLAKLREEFPGTDAAFEATFEGFSRAEGHQKDEFMRGLAQGFSDRLNFEKIIQSLKPEPPSPQIESWLRMLVNNAPEGRDRAIAIMGFASYVKNLPEFQRAFQNNPHLLAKLPVKQRQYLSNNDNQALNTEVIPLLEEVIKNYSGLSYRTGGSFSEAAKRDLYELQHLLVGMKAPEIEAKDLDGIEFRLSDYSGKIVMLDFWGHWCGPCRRMYPEERELVQRLAGTPFVLIGVNSDQDLEFAREAVQSEGLAWRHFWNGPAGTRGPIAKAWNIDAWPTVYLMDGNGVIRYKDVLGSDLTGAIETLLAEIGHQVDLGDLN